MTIANGIQNPNFQFTDTGTAALAEAANNTAVGAAAGASAAASDVAALTLRVAALETVTWDDIQGPALQAAGASALTQEAFGDTPFICLFMSHAQDDELHFAFQLPHRWNRGEVRCHIHVVPMVNPAATQTVIFDGAYAWAHPGTAIPAAASW